MSTSKNDIGIKFDRCAKCGKEFLILYREGWVYRIKSKYYCSYHCWQDAKKERDGRA